MKKLEIEKTKPTLIISVLKVDYYVVLVSSISNFFNNKTSLANKWMSNLDLVRDHPFKTLANFHDFWSAFQQNAYEGDFRSLCTVTFWPSANGDTPPALRHADVLNGWSLRQKVPVRAYCIVKKKTASKTLMIISMIFMRFQHNPT
jgi:hypothetical protein